MGDVFLREETESTGLDVVIQKPSTNPFRAVAETRVQVVKKHHTATIFPYGDQTFTVITLELEDKKDEEAARLLWKAGYDALSAHRTIQFPKMVGLMKSNVPSFILWQELANGSEVNRQHIRSIIVSDYLQYTLWTAIGAIRADTALTVSSSFTNWSFDVNAKTWHYDIARVSLEPPSEEFLSDFYTPVPLSPEDTYHVYYTPTPLPPGTTPPLLNDDDIFTFFEKTFGDSLYLWASLRQTTAADPLAFAQQGLLTFGAVVYRDEILAHFPSTPTPEWAFENRCRGIKANYSTKVLSRVDFLSDGDSRNAWLELCFSLRFPLQECNRLRAAYLCQSYLPHRELSGYEVYFFIDEISVFILGNFSHNLPHAYLFVPPLCIKVVNGMHCIPSPLPSPLFYWAVDPAGVHVIPEKEWDKYTLGTACDRLR
ncbi:hypothetical protein PQX77_006700 [Marasmius sp. AFHP31]|nr:hypothetical protein PQX77_006700 [Marasmius sp. AFHP31]